MKSKFYLVFVLIMIVTLTLTYKYSYNLGYKHGYNVYSEVGPLLFYVSGLNDGYETYQDLKKSKEVNE